MIQRATFIAFISSIKASINVIYPANLSVFAIMPPYGETSIDIKFSTEPFTKIPQLCYILESRMKEIFCENITTNYVQKTLINMVEGQYKLNYFLRDDEIKTDKINTLIFSLFELGSLLPKFLFPLHSNVSVKDKNGFISVPFNVVWTDGYNDVIEKLVEACLVLTPERHLSKSLNCGNIESNMIRTGESVAVGKYSAQLVFRLKTEPFTVFERNAVNQTFHIKELESQFSHEATDLSNLEAHSLIEFIPDYFWKPLKPWNTIPAGLEIRYNKNYIAQF